MRMNTRRRKDRVKQMNGKTIVACAFGAALLVTGCGKRMNWDDDDHSLIPIVSAHIGSIWGTSENSDYINPNYADALYYESYRKSFGNDWKMLGENTACSKRKAALEMSREIWTYSIKSYVSLDGVSGFIYNVGYICSVPHKIVRGFFCMDGVVCYAGALFKLALGTVAATVGLVAAPVINTLCHPCETLANLTVGAVFLDLDNTHKALGMNYGKYIFNTNLIATLWDLIWGAIVWPLLQTFLFWL